MERRGGRSSSRSPGRRRSYSPRSRSRSRSPPPPPPLSREEQEILTLTREARTVFVSQLLVRATERDARDFFAQAGRVATVALVRDRVSGKSKGFGYVEFEELEAVPAALLLSGAKFCLRHAACSCSGFPVAVKPAEAERNHAAAAAAAAAGAAAARAGDAASECRVYVRGLAADVTTAALRALLDGAGLAPYENAVVVSDSAARGGRSRGYGFATFPSAAAAVAAAATLHGRAVTGFAAGGAPLVAGRLNESGLLVTPTGEAVPLGGAPAALSLAARAELIARLSSATRAASEALSAQLAQALAVTLSGAGAGAGAGAPLLPPPPPPPPPPPAAPSICVAVLNAFDAAAETEPTWKEDVLADVRDEAARAGAVIFAAIDVPPPPEPGAIYILFDGVAAAEAARASLAGRDFGGRTLAAILVPLDAFLAKYPESIAAAEAHAAAQAAAK